MAISEEQAYKALGLGEKAQAVAEPATPQQPTVDNDPTPGDTAGAGENVQETAAPAVTGTDPTTVSTEPTAGSAGNEDADDDDGVGKQTQTPEERRANAARRRQQEQQQAIERAVEAERNKQKEEFDKKMQSFFDRAGLKNSFTGEPITNMEQFQAWDKQYREDQLKKGLQSGKLTPEILNEVIDSHPVVQKAKDLVSRSEEQTRAAQIAAAEVKVKSQLEEISKLDPSIKTVEDLLNAPNAKEFYALVKQGNSLVQAFRLANFDRLVKESADAARQQAVSNTRGKDHLQATGNSRGAGAAPVPGDELAMYRLLNPHATEAQIQAHYNKYRK